MKNTRIICLCMALIALLALVGCNSEIPEETTETVADTEAPAIETDPIETEPVETEPPFPIYEGPSAEFKFTLQSVLAANEYKGYKDFLAAAEKSYLIPALKETMIPQGMDIWRERGWLMISGYFPSAEISASSVIVAVDMATGAYVGEYYITNTDGTPHTSHAGGVAITERDMYISNGSTLFRIPLSEFLNAGQCGKVTIADYFNVPVRASFCNYSEGYLWVGDFQYGTSYPTDEYRHLTNRDGKKYYAWTVGYEVDLTTENGIKADAMVDGSYATPDIIFSMTEKIQGFALTQKTVALSQSYGRNNKSKIFLYENPMRSEAHQTVELNGKSVPLYFLDSKTPSKSIVTPPMTEGLAAMDGKLYILFESGADKYANGGGTDPTENVWTMIID
ncbi:MAG: hypothetical protein IIX44_06510 [Clostridia bacterium]|nr:hypothetical protein [Clostridia bacterium]